MFGFMKRRTAIALLLIVVAAAFAMPAAAAEDPFGDPKEIAVPVLNEIKVPTPERFELPNGMVVYLLEDHEFPVVDVQAQIRVGSIYDPPELVGLAELTGEVMRTGGSTIMDGDALDEKLESMGAMVEINVGNTSSTAFVSTLSPDIEEGLRILNELLRSPALPQEKIDLAKNQERTNISSRNDQPIQITFREVLKLIYGPEHPYARHTEYATVDAIARDHMAAFHQEYFHPDRTIMTVYGDFDSGRIMTLLEEIFRDWPRSTKPLPPDPEVKPTKVTGTFFADKGDMTQSVVVLGHEGMRMDDPDYPAMEVFEQALAGGFTGRIINEIRTKRGLAYAAGATIGAGLHHPGPMVFYVMTQTDSTAMTLGYLEDEIQKALDAPFTDEEMQLAKDAILNKLVFQFASKGAVLNRLATYDFYGYPQDFLQTYQERVKTVSAADVQQAAQRKVRYDDLTTMVVGTEADMAAPLAQIGDFTQIDVSIPEPEGAEVPEATPESLNRGQELLAAAAAATGGDALHGIKDLVVEESAVVSVQGMELQVSVSSKEILPDCVWSQQKLPMGVMTQSVCGDEAWMDAMQGPQDMPGDMLAEFRSDQKRDLIKLLRNHGALKAQALDEAADVDGMPARVVFVHSDDVKGWKIYLDRETDRIVRMDYRSKSMTGAPVVASEFMADYRELGGVFWPHQRRILHDGELFVTTTTSEFVVNGGVDPAVFKKP